MSSDGNVLHIPKIMSSSTLYRDNFANFHIGYMIRGMIFKKEMVFVIIWFSFTGSPVWEAVR